MKKYKFECPRCHKTTVVPNFSWCPFCNKILTVGSNINWEVVKPDSKDIGGDGRDGELNEKSEIVTHPARFCSEDDCTPNSEVESSTGRNWYFEGNELVITRGSWVIDRYKKHTIPGDGL